MRKYLIIFIPVFILSFVFWPYLPTQDNPSYFDFADSNKLIRIPNWQNVLSNIPFFFVGIFGINCIYKNPKKSNIDLAGQIFSLSLLLTCFGSAYFHWHPNPATLYWDRMPMALGFGGLCSIITIDRLFTNLSKVIVILLTTISVLTVVNWGYGTQDLRPYLILQFMGGFFVFWVALWTKSNQILNRYIFLGLGLYIFAKILEIYDQKVFDLLALTSGHALKHLSAASSAYFVLANWKPSNKNY